MKNIGAINLPATTGGRMDPVNRRKWPRKKLNPMAVAAIRSHGTAELPAGVCARRQFYFVDVYESSFESRGMVIEIPHREE